MTSAETIIVGAGPSGTFAAYQLRSRRPLVLDVGYRAPESALEGNFYELRRTPSLGGPDLFAELIGPNFESLHNVFHSYVSLRLKGPRMRFVTRGAAELSPLVSENFDARMSFAAGGLANAWAAGLFCSPAALLVLDATNRALETKPVVSRSSAPAADCYL